MTSYSKNIPYAKIMAKHRPEHNGDEFSFRHPKMDIAKRAKLFAPFDALRGFDAAIDIANNNASYVEKRDLDEGEIEYINHKLNRLYEIFKYNKTHHRTTTATVSAFVPACDGEGGDTFGNYTDIYGDITAISHIGKYIMIDNQIVEFKDIENIVF